VKWRSPEYNQTKYVQQAESFQRVGEVDEAGRCAGCYHKMGQAAHDTKNKKYNNRQEEGCEHGYEVR
jgi:hypothetical protein